MTERVLASWSGGKDSCMALYEIQKTQNYQVAALLTTVTRDYDCISMHGVRRILLERQAQSLGLPLHQVYISKSANNEEYESKVNEALSMYRRQGISSIVFGDLFLQDIRQYREHFLAPLGVNGLFPIWGKDTSELIKTFIELGFKAIVTCVDSKALDGSFSGRLINNDFRCELPHNVDPCGENGEFHTFVFGGPLFKEEIRFKVGDLTLRDGFYFCDLLPD